MRPLQRCSAARTGAPQPQPLLCAHDDVLPHQLACNRGALHRGVQDIDPDGPLLPATQLVIEVGPKAGVLLLAAQPGATSARGMASAPPPLAPYGGGGPVAPSAPRPTAPVGRTGTWTPPVPAGGVPNMPSRY